MGCRVPSPAGSLRPGYANDDFALARYELDGDLDPGFSGDGMLTTDMGHEYARASSIAVQPDGRIVVGGSAYSYILDYTASYGALARYLSSNGPADADADGVLDSDDLCPQVFAPQHSDGCHRFRRTISLELERYRKHRYFYGLLSSACASDSRVRVFKIKRGGRRVRVASGTPDYDPDDIRVVLLDSHEPHPRPLLREAEAGATTGRLVQQGQIPRAETPPSIAAVARRLTSA